MGNGTPTRAHIPKNPSPCTGRATSSSLSAVPMGAPLQVNVEQCPHKDGRDFGLWFIAEASTMRPHLVSELELRLMHSGL